MSRVSNKRPSPYLSIIDRARVRYAGGNGIINMNTFADKINAVLPGNVRVRAYGLYHIRYEGQGRNISPALLWLVKAGAIQANDEILSTWAVEMLSHVDNVSEVRQPSPAVVSVV